MEGKKAGGWILGESAVLEVDVALSIACSTLPPPGVEGDLGGLRSLVSPDEARAFHALVGESRPFNATLEVLALLSGTLTRGDYEGASLAMRSLDLDGALEALRALDAPGATSPEAAQDGPEAILEAYPRHVARLYTSLGFGPEAIEGALAKARRDMERVLPLLAGGPGHEAFWQWVDRFYYGRYLPWRAGRADFLAAARAKAVEALGGPQSDSGTPALAWLPAENPLKRWPELAKAVEGGLEVFFWLDPFGIADIWSVEAGRLVVSTASTGPLYEAFSRSLDDIARRAAALGDPSRLAILRMIRSVGVTNTAMASWLGLSRPTVSVHAKVLRDAGLIRSRKEGRETRHEVIPGEVDRLFRDLAAFLDLETKA